MIYHENIRSAVWRVKALLVAASLSVSIVSGSEGSEGNWLNVALSGSPVTRDPKLVQDALTLSVIHNTVFETLVRYGGDRGLAIEPALATSWEVKENGTVWEFVLRSGVHFHDGSLLAAGDVVNSFRQDPTFTGRIEAVDAKRIRVILPDKTAGFAKTISQVTYGVTKLTADGAIIGTGPFYIDHWGPPESVELKTFSDYWGEKPSLEGVTFYCSMPAEKAIAMMRSGEIDVLDIVPPSMARNLSQDKEIVLSILEGVNISFVHVNINNQPLDSAEFRQALSMLIHTEKIIRDVHFDQAISCRGILPPVIGGEKSGPQRIPYDPKTAKEIIKKYIGENNRPLKMVGLPFPRPYCPDPNAQARLIAGYLKGAGVKIDYYQTESMEDYLEKRANGDYDLLISGWVIDSRNPDDFYTLLFGIGDVEPAFGISWENAEFESLILQARRTVSVKKQWELYDEASDIFFREYPWILIAHTNQLGAYSNRIAGLEFNPMGELRLVSVRKTVRS